ncbi:MAG: ankyrin repeat domain-containing protein [Deltaproteobacteria bacterium]|nr:ankyrin repeat domain-containing protein [Deltaproteobacteria bacterium]
MSLEKLHDVLEKLPRDGLELRLTERHETPLIWAVSEGYHDIAVTLIEAGADLDARNVDGNTPLIRAACEGRTELASVLVKVGAKLDLQNEDGYSALILAKRRGHLEIVDLLLAAGADRTLVTDLGTTYDDPGHSPKVALRGRRDARLEEKIVDAVARSRDGRVAGRTLEKYVNLEEADRFVPTSVLRAAYVRYAGSSAPTLPNHVLLEDDLELGIVSSAVPELARAISSLLCRSLEDARADRGGHLPVEVVRRVQLEIISPHGVAHLWGVTGHRFVLSRRAGDRSELLATILVGRSKDTLFFFTGRYNNLRHSTIAETVDFEEPDRDDPSHRWFDRFWFPDVTRLKPRGYHHIANFVVAKEQRGQKISRLLLDAITAHYAREHLLAAGRPVAHSQHLLCGRGFWQIGDPPWLPRMESSDFICAGARRASSSSTTGRRSPRCSTRRACPSTTSRTTP